MSENNNNSDKKNRRDFLTVATTAVGAVGVGAAVWPVINQMNPDSSVKALASTEVDLSKIKEGQEITVLWRGKPVFIKRRTKEEIASAEKVDLKELKDPQPDNKRVKKSEWLVLVGVCTHLGCVPISGKGDYGGWFCPCHGSHYDSSECERYRGYGDMVLEINGGDCDKYNIREGMSIEYPTKLMI